MGKSTDKIAQGVHKDPGSLFLNAFWDLASTKCEERRAAAGVIVNHLTSGSDGKTLSKDGEYALKRLIKGLASSRLSARQGFATCLTEML